ncbi:MAG: porin [Pirellulales bacterium]|nr:porin [Pirellulales bacterium]
MKTYRWMMAFALLGMVLGGSADARTESTFELQQPVSLEGLARDAVGMAETSNAASAITISSFDEATAPKKLPDPAYGETGVADACTDALTCGNAACDRSWQGCGLCDADRGLRFGGWLQAGITANGQDPNNGFNGPVLTNDLAGELQMHQLWFYAEKPVDTGGCGWDFGGRFDMIYGTDWRCANNPGLEQRINSIDQLYGLALPQFYAEVGYNDLKVKVGHFAPLFGYETVPAVNNFFYSHAYALCYSEPITVTGMLADYQLDKHWSIRAGFHRGYNMFEDNNNRLNFLGGLTWKSCDGRDKINFNLDNGAEDATAQHNRFVYSLSYEHQYTDRLKYAIHHILGNENGTGVRGSDDNWYGLTHYFFYTLNEKWTAGARFEWFRDTAGAQVAGLGNIYPGHGWPGRTGFSGDFTALTVGLNYRPRPNIVFRPELRCDWYNGTRNVDGQLPFDDGTKSHQFLLSADMVVQF